MSWRHRVQGCGGLTTIRLENAPAKPATGVWADLKPVETAIGSAFANRNKGGRPKGSVNRYTGALKELFLQRVMADTDKSPPLTPPEQLVLPLGEPVTIL
jgi:hypothetical protein